MHDQELALGHEEIHLNLDDHPHPHLEGERVAPEGPATVKHE